MQNYIVTLTNYSKSQWPYCVKASNQEAAVKKAKKLHHHTPGMPRTQVAKVEVDERTSHQRAHEIASERANNWRKSLTYRYGPIMNEEQVKAMIEARVNHLYHDVYEEYFMADFDVWLQAKQKEAA